jgi:hypothetical protein
MDLLIFYGLACLLCFRYRSHGFRSLSMYFPIDYHRFRNYRNIGAVFVSDNIVLTSFSRKNYENESDLASYRSFSSLHTRISTRRSPLRHAWGPHPATGQRRCHTSARAGSSLPTSPHLPPSRRDASLLPPS